MKKKVILVEFENKDVETVLGELIKHKNKDHFVKLLAPMICQSPPASKLFFKLLLANSKLPTVFPIGSLVKIPIDSLSYTANKEEIAKKFGDDESKIIATIYGFRGYHDYNVYEVEYMNVDSKGKTSKDKAYCAFNEVELIEEF
jgi:hypothetical protein